MSPLLAGTPSKWRHGELGCRAGARQTRRGSQNGLSGRAQPRPPARPPEPGSWPPGPLWRSSRCHFSWVACGARLLEEGERGGEDFPALACRRPWPPELGTPGRRARTQGLGRENLSLQGFPLLGSFPLVPPRRLSGLGLRKWGGGALKSDVGNSGAFKFPQLSPRPVLNASVRHYRCVALWACDDSPP